MNTLVNTVVNTLVKTVMNTLVKLYFQLKYLSYSVGSKSDQEYFECLNAALINSHYFYETRGAGQSIMFES